MLENGAGRGMVNQRNISVLYLDDDVAGARLVQRSLGRHGFAVETAPDGVTGIKKLRDGKYDVLVTDQNMPVVTGLDLIRKLVKEDALPSTIMVTGLGDEAIAVEALKLGVDDYIVKDVKGHYLELLPTVISEVISRKNLQKERQQLEALAEQQRQQLIQAGKMVALGTLVTGVAHEINNPNNNILLNSTLLIEAWESIEPVLDAHFEANDDFIVGGLSYEEMRDGIPALFAGIYDGSQRIKRIVSDLKDFARQDAAEMNQCIDVNVAVQTALALSAHLVKKSTSALTVELAESLPSVDGNGQRLEQVLVNLIHNACQGLDHCEQSIYVTTQYHSKDKTVEIRIKDEGCGMPEEILDRIMDPFFTTRRDEGGTGLGLSVSAGIIEEHEGVLRFESKPGKGTTAIIILPAQLSKNNTVKGVRE